MACAIENPDNQTVIITGGWYTYTHASVYNTTGTTLQCTVYNTKVYSVQHYSVVCTVYNNTTVYNVQQLCSVLCTKLQFTVTVYS